MNATINVDSGTVVAEVMTIQSSTSPDLVGERFISLRIGFDLTLILDGFNEAGAAQARQIAHELLRAADEIEPVAIVPPLVAAGEL